MLAVRIGQLTAKVFHLLDLQPCRPLPWTFTIYSLPVSRRTTVGESFELNIAAAQEAETLTGTAKPITLAQGPVRGKWDLGYSNTA